MNIYVVYKFNDYAAVKKSIQNLKSKVQNITFFYFKPDNKPKFWHRRASRKIQESKMVIFFDSFDDDHSCAFKHIKWELKRAEKYNKRIVVVKKNIDNIKTYASQIYSTDYSDDVPNKSKYIIKSTDEIATYLETEANWTVESNLIKSDDIKSDMGKQLLLEQYRIMIDTSEKLMERRQATGNLYTTICSALIAFIGASFVFGSHSITAAICLLSGIIINMLCYNWRCSLNAYELNNSGKFEVINQIEHHLPAEMFECEYRYNTLKGIRSYATRERTLPLVFMCLGGILIVLAIVLLMFF